MIALALAAALLLPLAEQAHGVLASTRLDWGSKAPMPTAREYVRVAAAPNGKLYAVGGQKDGGLFATVEEYDPSTNTWVTKSSMPTARTKLGLATALNGKLYAIGGVAGGSALATVEEYNPATNGWATKAPMPTPRDNFGLAAAANGKLYAVGGSGSVGFLTTVEEYDPATNTWATKQPMPTPRANLAFAAAPNGRLYAVGGDNASTTALATVEEYDPAANTWAAKLPMPTPRVALGLAAAPNGKLYAVGGNDNGGSPLATVQEYNPATNTWTTRLSMPNATSLLGLAAAPNGKLYAVGGGSPTATAAVAEYDPSSNTWATPNAPSKVSYPPRYGAAVAVLNQKIYVIGGYDGTQVTNTTFEYNPAANSWRQLTSIPTRRFAAGAAAINGKIYVVGGYDGGALAAFSELDPAGNGGNGSWRTAPALAELPAAVFWSGVAAGPNGKLYVVAGNNGSTQTTTVREYDPVGNSWTTRASMSVPRETLAVTLSYGMLYAIGGQNSGGVLSTVEAFSFPTVGAPNGSWATVASLPAPRSVLAAVTGPTGKLYALGGSTTSGSFPTPAAEVFEHDPTLNSWSGNPKLPASNQFYRASLPTARDGLSAAVVGNTIFAIGGSGVGNGINAFESAFLTEAPSISVGGPYTVQSGGSLTLTASGSDPESGTLSYAWDLNGDLLYETNGQTVSFSTTGVTPGAHVVHVRAMDPRGAYAVATTNVTVTSGPTCDAPARPNVSLTTTKLTPGVLQATFTAHSSPQVVDNVLTSLKITAITNAAVTLNGSPITVNQTVTLPGGSETATLVVDRRAPQNPAASTTVAFEVSDACGVWRSFVGGGPSAF